MPFANLACHGALDNDLNHLAFWGGDAAIWSMDNSVVPDQGDYFLFAQGDGTAKALPSFGGPQVDIGTTTRAVVWAVQRQQIIGGTRNFASGDIVAFVRIVSGSSGANWWYLAWTYATATTAKLRLYYNATQVAESASAVITRGTSFTWRIQWGPGSIVRVWIDGTLVIDDTFPAGAAKPELFLGNWCAGLASVFGQSLPTNQWHKYAGTAMFSSSGEADRPGTTTHIEAMFPAGNSAVSGETDAGDETDCADDTLGDFANWDKWPGTPSEATFNCLPASTKKEVSTLDDVTVPGGSIELVAVQSCAWVDANVASKTVTCKARWLYSGSASEVTYSNISLDTFSPRRGVLNTPPGGGSWSDAVLDALELGLASDSGNGANIECAALANLFIGVDHDPPDDEMEWRTDPPEARAPRYVPVPY